MTCAETASVTAEMTGAESAASVWELWAPTAPIALRPAAIPVVLAVRAPSNGRRLW